MPQQSGVRDEGRPLATGVQAQVANHRKRLESKAQVVSVTEKALQGVRYEPRKTNTSEPSFNRRNFIDIKTEDGRNFRTSLAATCSLARWCPA